ncbi:MAG: class I SAM-dependent methyltransferase [Bdellovibrionales bacterium]|nr:class I SAM-dependent methyltransferase [Bdellovibrionales bacterium]
MRVFTMLSQGELLKAIHASDLPLDEAGAVLAARFGEILYQENENQNLTRIIGIDEFVDGHLVDVIELLSLPTVGTRIMDIGTGSGVPGLLAAAVSARTDRYWYLTESERNKADYLVRAKEELALSQVTVFSKRAEEVVSLINPDTIIARAVGSVDKIAGWIWNCSTWNNLVLFKSRGWEKEWEEAKSTRFGKKLTITHTHDYSSHGKTRVLVTLKRKSN